MITKIFNRVKEIKGVKNSQGRAREGWGKPLFLKSGGAPAKRAEVEARAGKNFYHVGSRSDSFGAFPQPPPFCPPERKLSKFSVRIFAKKSSDFVQDKQKITTCVMVFSAGERIELSLTAPKAAVRPLDDPAWILLKRNLTIPF